MRSKKLLILYAFLLIVAVVTMVQLWRLNQRPQEIGPRDYPEIKEEGILRMITEYNQSGYFVSGDTVQGFQYELSQAIAKLSGLEVQTHLEMSLAKSFEELSDNKCDVIARNIPITSEMRENYLFTEPIVLNKQVLVQRTAEANNGQAPIRNQLDLAQKTLYIYRAAYDHGSQRRYRLCRMRPTNRPHDPEKTAGSRYPNGCQFYPIAIVGGP